jgi:mannose-6-phosphate isomerase-like protein (cupin superfamily)
MQKIIKVDQAPVKKNSSTCELNEYLFNQPNLGVARVVINGRYPSEEGKKVINTGCDLMYFVLEGEGIVHTESGDFKARQNDAILLGRGKPYWTEGKNFKVLVISAPEWTPEQYKEI